MSDARGVRKFLDAHPQAVRVTIAEALGSSPREVGAWMLVASGAIYCTIGGGQLEYLAMDRARAMLRDGVASDQLDVPLGPEIGQCCGGRVKLRLDRVDEPVAAACIEDARQAEAAAPHVYLFGAGHVGRALAAALVLLPVRVIVADPRAEEIRKVGPPAETSLTPVPEELIRNAPPGSAFVILTHEHALDFILSSEALARDDAAYAGMIGSRTKLKTFRNWYLKTGGNPQRFDRLVTPIGGSTRDKRPEVIAAFAAAEILRALFAYADAGEVDAASERIA